MSEKTVKPTQEVEDNTNEEAQTTEPQISFDQIRAVTDIIDMCSARGSFKGVELEAVGQIRNAFGAFVDFHAPKQEEEPPPTPSAEATEETSE
jgi:hypothetical protein